MKNITDSNGKLLHCIFFKEEFPVAESRIDICNTDQLLQIAALKLNNNKTFKAHQHIPLERNTNITQECWIIVQGKIKAMHYDENANLLDETVLEAGDITITYYGGHNYLSLEDNTLVYEIKNGPYLGFSKDKKVYE